MYMGLQNERAYLDPMTKIFNRNYLNHVLKQFSYLHAEVCGIMLDMDHFKAINDTYGHDEGDAALIEASKILVKASVEHAVPIRFAGDEFIILIPSGTAEDTERIIQIIRQEESAFNASGKKPYRLLFSIGTGKLAQDISTEQFLKDMDNSMYEQKKLRHMQEKATAFADMEE